MRKYFFAVVLIAFLTVGCKTLVKLAVRNEDSVEMNVKVDIKDEHGIKTKTISMRNIRAGDEENQKFKVCNGGSFSVSGFVFPDIKVFAGNDVTVTGEPDPLIEEIILKSNCCSLDDSNAFETLSESFKNLGPDIGAKPLGLKNALETMIGALVVVGPNESGNNSKKIFYRVSPKILDVYVMKMDDIRYPKTSEEEEVIMSGEFFSKAAFIYSPFGKFGIQWDQKGVYEAKWKLSGFGTIVKVEDSSKPPTGKIASLSTDHKNKIIKTLNDHPEARVYYINSAYVLERADISVKKARKLSAGNEVDALSIISANSVYTFNKSTESKKEYSAVVLNYWGDEYGRPTLPAVEPEVKTLPHNKSIPIVSSQAPLGVKGESSFLIPTGRSVKLGVGIGNVDN